MPLTPKQIRKYLSSSRFLNFYHPSIRNQFLCILSNSSSRSLKEIAETLFLFVRDQIPYKQDSEISTPRFLRASSTLLRGYGHCVAKAILLASFTRLAGIPTRLHFCDLLNHRITPVWKKKWGDKLLWHGYIEIYLSGNWIMLNPAYDKALCQRHGYPLAEFNSGDLALSEKFDIHGNPFMEYTADHGVYARIPYFRIASSWILNYGPLYLKHLLKKPQTF